MSLPTTHKYLTHFKFRSRNRIHLCCAALAAPNMIVPNLNQLRGTAVSNLHQHCELRRSDSVTRPPEKEENDANNKERRIEAGLRGNGPGEAARNREQGRKSQPRRRPQGEQQPLVN